MWCTEDRDKDIIKGRLPRAVRLDKPAIVQGMAGCDGKIPLATKAGCHKTDRVRPAETDERDGRRPASRHRGNDGIIGVFEHAKNIQRAGEELGKTLIRDSAVY